MALNCHYYVLSMGAETSVLFEAFRDQLIEVRNQGFPVTRPPGPLEGGSLTDHVRKVDGCFAHYHEPDPLGLVVVGSKQLLSAYTAVTVHGPALIGLVPGDHTATSTRDLGQIVWPVIKAAMSRETERALRSLDDGAAAGRAVRGLEAVAEHVRKGSRATLLVEEGFHVRGSLDRTGRSPAVTSMVDVRDVLDDAVDAVIERALAVAGRVVFTPDGSLAEWDRIALLSWKEETR
jgi:hypothetical protein